MREGHFRIHLWLMIALVAMAPKVIIAAEPFEHAFIGLEAGALQFFPELSQNYGVTPQARGTLTFTYSENLRSRIAMGYAHLTGWEVSDVHMAQGDVGLDYALPFLRAIEFGGGVSLFFVRADPKPEQEEAVLAYQLYDNESEFGWHLRTNYSLWRGERFGVHVAAMYHEIWSRPNPTRMVWLGLGAEVRAW